MINIKNKDLSQKKGNKAVFKKKHFVTVAAMENSVRNGIFKSRFPITPVSIPDCGIGKNAVEITGTSDDKLKLVMNAALDAIISINTTGHITYWNSQAEAIFGWCESEVLGQSLAELVIPDRYRSRHIDGMALYLKTGKGPALNKLMELSAIRRSGEEFAIELTIKPIKQGVEEFFCAFIRDITEKKLVEKKLSQSEARLIEAQEVAKVGSWETDLVTLKVIWSDETYRIFELDAGEFETSHPGFLEFVHPDDRETVDAAFVNSLTSHTVNTVQHRIITKSGHTKFVMERWKIYHDDQQKPVRAAGTCQDITEQKKVKAAVEKAYEEKNTILERIDDGFFAVDENSIVTYWNKKAEILLNAKREDMIGRNVHEVFESSTSRAFYHNYQKAIREKTTVTFVEFSSRTNKWFAVSAYASDNGLSVYFKDVTEQKVAEEKLKKSELLYRTLIEQATDSICIADAAGKFIEMNSSGCRMFGYSREEILQLSITDVLFAEDVKLNPLKTDELKTGETVINERRIKRKDGTALEVELNGKMLADGSTIVFGRDISARKESERLIKESEAKYRSFFESSVDGILLTVTDGDILSANPAACEIFKMTEEEICAAGRFGVTDLTDPRLYTLLEERKRTGRVKGELTLIRKDGGKFEAELTSAVFTDSYGRHRTSMIVRDISESKQAEDKLKESENKYRTLFEQNMAGIYQTTQKGVIINCNQAFAKMLKYDSPDELLKINASALYFSAAERNDFCNHAITRKKINNYESVLKCKDGSPLYFIENVSLRKDDVTGEAFFDGIMIDITEKKQAEFKLKESELRYRSIIEQATDAICIADACMNVIDVNPYCCDMLGYTKEEFLLLSITDIFLPEDLKENPFKIAALKTGKVIRNERRLKRKDGSLMEVEINGRILEDGRFIVFAHDISERKKAADKVKESELRYRSLNEQATDAICIIDASGNFIDINPYACETFGYSLEEALQLTLPDILFPEDLAENPMKLKELKLGKTIRNERRLKRKDGTAVHMAVSTKLMEDGRMIMFGHDITERKQSEIKLGLSEKRYRQIVETAQEGIWVIDGNSSTTFVNKKMCEILEYTEEEMIGRTNYSFKDAAEQKLALQQIERRKKGFKETHESKFITKSGRHIVTQVSTNPIFDQDGTYIGAIAMFTDITERKQAELLLRESNERYNLISKATNDMVWDWDLITGKVYRNKEGWKKIFRSGDKEIVNGSIDDWYLKIHPDDLDTVNEVQQEIQTSEKDFFEVECRMLRDDGTYAYVHDRGHIIRNGQGKAVRLIGATQDITLRKEAELQVVKSEFRFRSLVQNSSDIICIFNSKGYFTYSSPAIKKILGFEPEETIEKNVFAFLHPDDADPLKEYLLQIKPYKHREMPLLRFKNTQGEWRWIESRVTDMSDNLEVAGYVFNCRDVTERKIAEAEIEKLSFIARETNNAVIITNPEGEITWVNEGFTQITEFEFKDVIGKKPGAFLQGKDSNTATVNFMHQKLKNKEPFECDILNYSKSGGKYWLRIQCQPQFDDTGKLKYFFAIETDVTKEKEAEEVLKASEERYRYLFNNNPASIFIWDIENMEILEVNNTMLDMYGYGRTEILSKSVLDLRRPAYHNQIKLFAEKARQTPDFVSENTWKHLNKQGEEMYMNIASHRIEFKGREVMLAIATNITEKILLEKELENEKLVKQQEITQAVISAQEQERQELGGELHDNVNQILAGSLLYLGLAKKELKTDHPYLQETDTLINTAISEIRNLSHSLIPPSLHESEFLDTLKHLTEVTQKTSGIVISLQAGDFDEKSICDKLKLTIYRIVQEQINNILKHAAAQHVVIQLVKDNEKTLLCIKDDGIGFDTSKKAKGVGLLNIQTRASLFNGVVSIISSAGNGCEVRVLFN